MNRYARQVILPEIGKDGQELFGKSTVLIIGVGALGTFQASFLARSGVGRIILLDRDIVELNNLQRQVLFDEGDIGKSKALAAKEHLTKVNSSIEIETKVTDFNYSNAEELIRSVDVIIDGTDNMDTRYLINDVCLKQRKPWIYGGAVGTYGIVYAIMPDGPCFKCIFPQPPEAGDLPTCDTAGVMNTIPAVVAALQVTECFKVILGEKPSGKMLTIDLWTHEIHKVDVTKLEGCPACSAEKYEFLQPVAKKIYTSLCGRNAIQIVPEKSRKISLTQLADKLRNIGDIEIKPGVLFFRTDDIELVIFEDCRTIVKGTEDPVRAKTIFSKYIGD